MEYVELLLNSIDRCIAIRPCEKSNPNAIRWGRLKEGRWCASTLGCRGLAKTLFDIMEWDEDLRYRFRGQFVEDGDNKLMLFELDEPEMIKVEEIVLPPKENSEEAEGETVKKTIYIFPNNKNIILAANQAKLLTKDKEVIVIPTKTVPQGITAVVTYSAEASVEENTEAMSEEIKNVKTGQITYAVRDTHIDDKEIHEGDYMGIGDAGILAVNTDIQTVFLDMIAEMVDEDSAIVSIYYGADVTEEDAEALAAAVDEKFADLEVELQMGGQPVYYYIASVE